MEAARPPLLLEVPGSTSNLGPGFDLLGLALDLLLRATVEAADVPARGYEFRGEAARLADQPAANLFERALARALGPREPDWRGLRITLDSEIPLERGLGSSGAAVAAGLRLGAALASASDNTCEAPAPETWIAVGTELEGHPDNVAASLLGGCTLVVPGDPPSVLRPPLSPELGFAVAWPETPMPTERARRVLPRTVSFADAVENPRRLALLLEGLRTADPALLRRGGEDRLHVPYRLPLLPGAARALEAARDAGAALATLSGSGSALLAIARPTDCAEIAEAMASVLRAETGAGTGRALCAVLEVPGPRSIE